MIKDIIYHIKHLGKHKRRYVLYYTLIQRRGGLDSNGNQLPEITKECSRKMWACTPRDVRNRVRDVKGYNISRISVGIYRK